MKKLLYITLSIFWVPMILQGQTQDENYVRSTTYQVATQNENVLPDEKLETIAYYDGLGRPRQTIAARAGGDRENIAQHAEYDIFGMQTKEYLPWAGSNGTGLNFINPATLKSNIEDFYETEKYDNTTNPYSRTVYDPYALRRTVEVGAPGKEWKVLLNSDADHTMKYVHSVNNVDDVYRFSVTYNVGSNVPNLLYDGYYNSHELYKKITRDENWREVDGDNHSVHTFTDKQGRTILRRHFNGGVAHESYYIYDDLGNLSFVLSPKATDKVMDVANEALAADYQVQLAKLGYEYRYDDRNRLIWKKLPGKAYEEIIYNKLDQPVLTQDANLRADGKWHFTKYDAFGRIAYTGLYESNAPRATIETQLAWVDDLHETQATSSLFIGGTNVYYSNDAFPDSSTSMETLTINYYETYVDTYNMTVPPTVFGVPTTTALNGLPTVSKVKVLEKTYWITSITGYDNKARVIFGKTANPYLDTTDETRSLLDFTGKPVETWTAHTKGTHPTIETRDYFSYDHTGRLLTHEQKIDNEPVQLIAHNTYDELGRLIRKDVGGETFVDGYTDLTNATVGSGEIISKVNPTTGWDSGAKTRGEVIDDGGIQLRIEAIGNFRFGLLKTTNTTSNWQDYDFGLDFKVIPGTTPTVEVRIIDDGDVEPASSQTFAIGDTFGVRRVGTQYRFYKNSNTPFTTRDDLTSSNTDPLVGKLALHSPGVEVSGFTLFGANIDRVLQEVDYKYNIRGWLTDINDVDSQERWNTDLFKFRINYTSTEGNVGGNQYNGNITQTIWRTGNSDDQKRSYSYFYDNLNRLTSAHSRKGNGLNLDDFHTIGSITYDKNGNLLTLNRNGDNGSGIASAQWDKLVYTVNGNQLDGVLDDSNWPGAISNGFEDHNTGSNDFVYDANGNMIEDKNRGITDIEYNHLNLPRKVTFDNLDPETGTTKKGIVYVYDALGGKLEKQFFDSTTGPADVITKYANGYIYKNHGLQFFSHPEGYVKPVQVGSGATKGYKGGQITYSTFEYVFQYTDHLGNIRLSYTDADLNGSISQSEIIEESNYYPFGLKHKGYNDDISPYGNSLAQEWKFGNNQYNEELGLKWYDISARNYDPALGRWMNIDPLAEQMRRHSPYNYAFDNPVFFMDPDGMRPVASPTFSSWLAEGNQSGGIVDFTSSEEEEEKNDTYTYDEENGLYRNNRTGELTDNWRLAIGNTSQGSKSQLIDLYSDMIIYLWGAAKYTAEEEVIEELGFISRRKNVYIQTENEDIYAKNKIVTKKSHGLNVRYAGTGSKERDSSNFLGGGSLVGDIEVDGGTTVFLDYFGTKHKFINGHQFLKGTGGSRSQWQGYDRTGSAHVLFTNGQANVASIVFKNRADADTWTKLHYFSVKEQYKELYRKEYENGYLKIDLERARKLKL